MIKLTASPAPATALPRHSCPVFRKRALTAVLTAVGAVFLASCSTDYYRQRADIETSGIIEDKTPAVPNMEPEFTIEPPEAPALNDFPKRDSGPDYFGDAASLEEGAKVIGFGDALQIAVTHNRDYLQRKENLYEEALRLTLIRHDFDVIPFANGRATIDERAVDVGRITPGMDRMIRDTTVSGRARGGFSWLLKTGALLSTDLTLDFVKFVNGELRTINNSSFIMALSQPLLRGAGSLAVTENLTQAERNLLYSLREFARFRKTFAISVATDYYDILRARDRVRNNWLAFQGFQLSVERERALADEDRSTLTEFGQLRQASLNSELAWINAVQFYLERLDDFKILLGLPVETRIALEESVLKELRIVENTIDRDEAVLVAVNTRLDLQNSRDRITDADRRIRVFAQDFLPGLDLVSSIEINSDDDARLPGLDSRLNRWSVGADIDLDPDKKQERNVYRAALIALNRNERNLDFDTDNIKLEIYSDLRDLEQARRQYDISELGVELAQARLEEQQLLMELGRGTARDLVDARNDLNDSQNDLTGALVNYTVARLNLWRDMGILVVNKDGSWVTQLNEAES